MEFCSQGAIGHWLPQCFWLGHYLAHTITYLANATNANTCFFFFWSLNCTLSPLQALIWMVSTILWGRSSHFPHFILFLINLLNFFFLKSTKTLHTKIVHIKYWSKLISIYLQLNSTWRSPGEGKGYPLQYSGLENSMDCIVHGVTESRKWPTDFHFHLVFSPRLVKHSQRILFKVCMLSHFSSVWLFASLWTVAHQAPLSIGFSRQEYWSGLPCPPPGDLPDPGNEPVSFMFPELAGGFLPLVPPGKPFEVYGPLK